MKTDKTTINSSHPFKCIFEQTIVNLIYTNRQVQNKLHSFFDDYNITLQQYNILRILRGAQEPLSTSKIRMRMMDKMSDTSRLVKRLLHKNLVERESCCSDRRLVDVIITQNGLLLLEKIDQKVGKLNKMLCNLSEEECRVLGKLLDKINCKDGANNCNE